MQRRYFFITYAHRIKAFFFDIVNLQNMRTDNNAVLRQCLLGYGTGKNERCRQATGKMTAAAIIIKALITHMACVVRMTGAHLVGENAVILGMLVAVDDTRTQRRTCRKAIEETALDFYRIAFLACCAQHILSGSTARHFRSNRRFIKRQSRRQAVKNYTDGFAMRFAIYRHFYIHAKNSAHASTSIFPPTLL